MKTANTATNDNMYVPMMRALTNIGKNNLLFRTSTLQNTSYADSLGSSLVFSSLLVLKEAYALKSQEET